MTRSALELDEQQARRSRPLLLAWMRKPGSLGPHCLGRRSRSGGDRSRVVAEAPADVGPGVRSYYFGPLLGTSSHVAAICPRGASGGAGSSCATARRGDHAARRSGRLEAPKRRPERRIPAAAGTPLSASDGTRTRDLRRDRPLKTATTLDDGRRCRTRNRTPRAGFRRIGPHR